MTKNEIFMLDFMNKLVLDLKDLKSVNVQLPYLDVMITKITEVVDTLEDEHMNNTVKPKKMLEDRLIIDLDTIREDMKKTHPPTRKAHG